MGTIQSLRQDLERQKGRLIQIQKELTFLSTEIEGKQLSLEQHEQAKELIRAAGQKTQEQIVFHISDLTSLALGAVLQDPYELKIEFIQRRNKTECDLFFTKNGENVDPLSATGGGAVDIASFALRIASWSMNRKKINNTIILDEPFHWLSVDNQERASAMLKELSHRLGIQFIIVTHSETLTSYADCVFKVTNRKYKDKWKVSIVKKQ